MMTRDCIRHGRHTGFQPMHSRRHAADDAVSGGAGEQLGMAHLPFAICHLTSRYNDRVKSFRRRLFASVSVLSLILCLATVGLWVRSYWICDHLRFTSSPTNWYVDSF